MDTIEQMRKSLETGNESSAGAEINNDLDDSALKVDDPIPGQGFSCVSFINPEDVVVRKDQWKFYKYHQYVISEYNKIFTELTDKLLEKDEINGGDISDVQERMTRVFEMNQTPWLCYFFGQFNPFNTLPTYVSRLGTHATPVDTEGGPCDFSCYLLLRSIPSIHLD